MRMTLERVSAGIKATPWRIVLYGEGGVGKSSLAAEMPAPVFLDPCGGTDRLDVARFEAPERWEEVFEAVEVLKSGKHNYKTLVIDELGRIEELSQDYIRRRHGADIFISYGKGYEKEIEEWGRLMLELDKLRTMGMNICLVGHAVTAKHKNPEGEDYDRYSLKLYEKVRDNLYERSCAFLFCRFETLVADKGLKKIGVSTGARVIHTQSRAAFKAKNRFGLPDLVPMSWEAIRHHIDNPPQATDILAEIEAILPRLKEVDANVVKTYLSKAGSDTRKLSQTLSWAQTKAAA